MNTEKIAETMNLLIDHNHEASNIVIDRVLVDTTDGYPRTLYAGFYQYLFFSLYFVWYEENMMFFNDQTELLSLYKIGLTFPALKRWSVFMEYVKEAEALIARYKDYFDAH